MKILGLISLVFIFSACSTTEEAFSYKNHCSGESYKRIKTVSELEKKHRRGEASKLEAEVVKRTKMFTRDSLTSLKPMMFECLAEAERMGNRKIYSICAVAEVDLKGKLTFLEVDDKEQTLEAPLKKCLTDQMQSFDYSRYPGMIAIQAINMDLDP